jgi:Protein of unknown function (DUF1064)
MALGIEIPPPPRHKYNAKPSRIDGKGFDSQLEMLRYCYLLQVEMAGMLSELEVHPRFALYADGGGQGAIEVGTYEADFAYNEPVARRVVEDVGGVLLALHILKRNLLLANYPTLVFREVEQCRKRWKSTQLTLSSLTAGI